jgi:hypothetical protein|tara:strand:- start:117 stop:233 length:117 start_codon:yes stop_codon:yes gene_type:complete
MVERPYIRDNIKEVTGLNPRWPEMAKTNNTVTADIKGL